MSLEIYKRNHSKENTSNPKRVYYNRDIIFRLINKDRFQQKEEPKNRLTGDKIITNRCISKNKPSSFIHSNSTKRFHQQNSSPKNINIININVNTLIINSDNEEDSKDSQKDNIFNTNNNTKRNGKNYNIFSKLGKDIINTNKNKNFVQENSFNKRSKSIIKNQNNNINLINKNNFLLNNNDKNQSKNESEKIIITNNNLNHSSNIQGIIQDLIGDIKSSPPMFNNTTENNSNNENNSSNKLSQLNCNDDEEMESHFKYWEILFTMELHVDNKLGIHNQVNKILIFIEREFIDNKTKINFDIFKNINLNNYYKKIVKITLIIITYVKFLLMDFNYDMTIKANARKMLSNINENLLLLISTQIFLKDNLNENLYCSKISKEFTDVYNKIIENKKLKNKKDSLNTISNTLKKNLDNTMGIIKQFSNNFFKIGYFKPIHSIIFDIFKLIDTYQVLELAEIIIKNVLFYIIHNNLFEKKNKSPPKIITYGVTNNLAALGFMNVPSPYLPKLSSENENKTYTLVLDLDETLVHFFYTPSGGTFLIRPYCFKFLEEMSKYYETVIFTAAMKEYADSILDLLDPEKKLINYRLYRNHTTITGIIFVKDLSKIGRDLNKIIIVDNLADNFKLQQNNGIQIGTWIDDMKDTQLNDLGKILTEIAIKKPNDVRNVIKKLQEDMAKKTRKNVNINPFKDLDISKYFK